VAARTSGLTSIRTSPGALSGDIYRKKNLARHLRRAKSREKCSKSFAASETYSNSTRQVVAIHTQYRDKVAGPIGWPAKIKLRRGHSPARIICETARKAGLRLFQPLQAALDQPCCDSSDLVSLFLRALKEPIGSTTPK
jgi:hypothetical protein